MAQEVDSYEFPFSYWLAKINAMKKSVKMLRQPHSQSSGEPSAKSMQFG
jgi:hypothetical protein